MGGMNMNGDGGNSGDTLLLPAGQLNLEHTFANGQMFRWRRAKDDWWEVVTAGKLLRIRENAQGGDGHDKFEYLTYPKPSDEHFVRGFLRLDADLDALYGSWQEADPYLGSLAERFAGLRIVKQDPEECLLSFICSTANFIPRIMKAVAILAKTWGEPIVAPDGTVLTHAFPRSSVIANADVDDLIARTGLEWRGANLVKVARQVAARPDGWLEALQKANYATARDELM